MYIKIILELKERLFKTFFNYILRLKISYFGVGGGHI
jgi:hypothetical protein